MSTRCATAPFPAPADRTLDDHKKTFRDRRVILNVERLELHERRSAQVGSLPAATARLARVAEERCLPAGRRPLEGGDRKLPGPEGRSRTAGRRNQWRIWRPGSHTGPLPVPIDPTGGARRAVPACGRGLRGPGAGRAETSWPREYVACRDDGGGVLVLSEFAGALSEMGEALRVNPWDVEGTANTLKRALEMDFGERSERMLPMQPARRVERCTAMGRPVHGVPAQSSPLARRQPSSPGAGSPRQHHGAPLRRSQLRAAHADYDGSLREFTDHYDDAVPTEEILGLLEALSTLPDVEVYMNSGRGPRRPRQLVR